VTGWWLRHRRFWATPQLHLAVMSRGLLALLLLALGGCWPASTTYYEAVNRSWTQGGGNGAVGNCPPMYESARVGGTAFMVTPDYKAGRAQIQVEMWIARGHQATFESWNMRVTSLADPKIQVSIPLSFSEDCSDNFHSRYCPLPSEPRIRVGPESDSQRSDSHFRARADLPPEFVGRFLLELPEVSDGPSKLEAKPLKFELRTHVLVQGTFGCS
jgi:hypothetical protein